MSYDASVRAVARTPLGSVSELLISEASDDIATEDENMLYTDTLMDRPGVIK
jgi:hypothetical protein